MILSKIFNALKEDEMNSALGIILNEIEKQGYRVFVNGVYIKSYEIFQGDFPELENQSILKLDIQSEEKGSQTFGIKFIDYHEIVFTDIE